MRTNSLRFKISVLFTSVLFTVLVVFGIILIFSVQHILYRDLDRELRAKTIQIEAIMGAYTEIKASASRPAVMFQNLISGVNISDINMNLVNKLWYADVKALNIQHDYFRVIREDGRSILLSENSPETIFPVFNEIAERKSLSREFITDIFFQGGKYRFINYPLSYNGKTSFSLQVATPTNRLDNMLLNFSGAVLVAIFFIIIATAIFGNIFADRILKPIMSVINVADTITHKDLRIRIKDTGEYDEIKTLVRSLNIMIERLEKSFNHINEFSSHVAHELKTPLAIMKGELEIKLSDREITEKEKDILETLLEEVDRLIITIKDMLLLSKFEYDTSIYNFEKIDMNSLFKNIYEQSLVLTDSRGIKLELELPEKKIETMADKTHLRRVFVNIINNAVNYTPRGGRIIIKVTILNSRINIDISDTGEGISPQNIEKIFNKFFRGKNDGSQINVGLGLNIALSIVRAHQGDIKVKSEPGLGSVFTVILPLC